MGRHAQTQLRPAGFARHERLNDIELSVPARPESVAAIRRLLGGVGESLGLREAAVEDLRLAVTEACTNVVRHAYGEGARGPIEISIRPDHGAVHVVVADRGRGIGPSPDTAGPGLGLPLIAAVADSVQIQQRPGAGSRVAMSFARPRAGVA
jgi:anti-sigma regulatory factor (Ser/Thr protein kinase)